MPDLYDACVTVAPNVHLRSVDEAIEYLREVPVWKDVYQALKPGAHVIVFTNPRTYDLVSLGIRAAGFENRDTIAADIPGPTWRPILMFRKPLEGTVVDNVLKHGTGALNIDGCRVRHASPEDFAKHKDMVDRIKEKGGSMADSWKNSSDLAGASDVKEGGRWPPNVVMTHAEGCKRVGIKEVKGSGSAKGYPHGPKGHRFKFDVSPNKDRAGLGGHGNEDGLETVEAWNCIEGCPIRALDEQTGERPSTLTGRADPNAQHDNPGDNHGASWFGGGNSQVYADSGGASRFFPQFEAGEPSGRWPPNVVMTHAEGCKRVGDKKIWNPKDTHSTRGSDTGNEMFGQGKGLGRPVSGQSVGYVGEDGFETVEAWECVEGCPVKALDEQSGELSSGGGVKAPTGKRHGFIEASPRDSARNDDGKNYSADSGGASRFFPQFEADKAQGRWPPNVVMSHAEGCKRVGTKKVHNRSRASQVGQGRDGNVQQDAYGAHASKVVSGFGSEDDTETVEAWECVDGCPVKALDEQSGELKTNPGTITSEMASMGYHGGSGSSREVVADSGGASRFFPQFEAPPAGLVRWLVRLVTPEGGRVLDPFNTGILDA